MQRDAPAFTTLPPLSLYVHIPWCVRKCPYCDFNSHAAPGGDTLPERDYVAALMADAHKVLRENPAALLDAWRGTGARH